jgi:hypothetical protein
MTDEQLLQEAYDALCVAFPGRQGLGEWEQNEPLRAALRERLAQIASGQDPTGLCVDWLSNVIRQADGNNNLGAGALAEKIVEAFNKLQQAHPKPAQLVPLSDEQIHNADPLPHVMFDLQRIEFARAIEAAVLAKLADKLRDAERFSWLLEHAYVAACFTDNEVILEIAGTNRTVPARATQGQIGVKPYTAREGIDAAMLASKAVKP